MLWSEKYAPKSLDEFCGNPSAVEQVRRWALDWKRGNAGKPLLLWGPAGTGKGALVSALASTMEWDVVEMNASDFRDKESVHRVIGAASSSGSLFGGQKLIFIDDVDAIAGRSDRGGGTAILEIVKSAKNPVILTGGDYWDRSLATIRGYCEGVEFRHVNPQGVASLLSRVLTAEGITAGREVAARIAELSNGDLRSAMNDLQAVAAEKSELSLEDLSVLSERDREKSIWDAMRTLMKTDNYEDATKVTWNLDVEPEMFMKWVEENVPAEYTERHDIAAAFDALSRADIFVGRIRARQYWGFLRYVNVLMTAGVALAKKEPYKRFVKYSFPQILKKLSASKFERAKMKAVGLKVGARCHASSSEAAEIFIPLVKVLMEEDKGARVPEVAAYFDFDAADIAFILEKSEKQAEKLLEGKEEPAEEKAVKKRVKVEK